MLKTLISTAGEIRVAGRVPVSDILFDDPAKWAADGTLERLNGLARLWRGTVGAEILPAATRCRPDRPADAARGGFWMSWDPDWPTSVILAASALDALSILALDLVPARRKGAVAVSCASSAAAALPEWIQEWNPQRIFCAYDATTRGDRAAKRLIRNDNRIVRLRPPLDGERWNETLIRDRAGVPLETDDRRLA